MAKTFSAADVAVHKTTDDLWIIVDDDVYDLTTFQTEHPGTPSSTAPSAPIAMLTSPRRWPEECVPPLHAPLCPL